MGKAHIDKNRGLARTFGRTVVAGKGGSFDRAVRRVPPADPMLRDLSEALFETLPALRDRKRRFDGWLKRIARGSETCRLLMTTPDIGPLTALALAGTIEDPPGEGG
ncbi:MAG: IS110 family transposase, partial [Pseudomonadota bacterium]